MSEYGTPEYHAEHYEITSWNVDRFVGKRVTAQNGSGSRFEVYGMYAPVDVEGAHQWVIAVLNPIRGAYTFHDGATITLDYLAEKFGVRHEADLMGLAMTIAMIIDGCVLVNGKEYR